MNDYRDCVRANTAAISLMKAAEEVARSVNNIRSARARGASFSYQEELLDRQWKYYRSLGGTAASPEQVRVPENPCEGAEEALRQHTAAMEAKYRECAASRAVEVGLAALSKGMVMTRAYLAMLEKVQAERRANPQFDSDNKRSGEWAAAFKEKPARVRAGLDRQFQEYRSSGGPAVRLADVSEIPNPCLPNAGNATGKPPGPSPITDTRIRSYPR